MFKTIIRFLSSTLAAMTIGFLVYGILSFTVDRLGYEKNFLNYILVLSSLGLTH
jgi:hypothetical protein